MERLDNVILRMAKTEPGTATDLLPLELRATIGTESDDGALWALRQARALDYLEADESHPGTFKATLTAEGWQRHAELMRDGAASRHAFMAMKFNDPDLDRVYWEHFKPAVMATGFDLRRADEGHKAAGLIDNRMRVEIRTSRFLLCDLSHGNAGAYWEARSRKALGARSCLPADERLSTTRTILIIRTSTQPTSRSSDGTWKTHGLQCES